jgi:hypothetical protein
MDPDSFSIWRVIARMCVLCVCVCVLLLSVACGEELSEVGVGRNGG